MSYGMASALQAAVYQALVADAALTALVGGNVFDAVPPGPVSGTWVTLGPELARDASDKTASGAAHDFTVSVFSENPGFSEAKAVAGAVSDALAGAALTLSRGVLVGLWFLSARANRIEAGEGRRIDLTFRARLDDTL